MKTHEGKAERGLQRFELKNRVARLRTRTPWLAWIKWPSCRTWIASVLGSVVPPRLSMSDSVHYRWPGLLLVYFSISASLMNSSSSSRFDELLRQADHHHEQYIAYLRLLHEAHAAAIPRTMRASTSDITASPLIKAVSFGPGPGQSNGLERARRLANESLKARPDPVFDGLESCEESSCDFLPLTAPSRTTLARTSETLVSCVLRPLEQESFSEGHLVSHIRSIDEGNQDTVTALGDVWHKRNELDASNVLASFETGDGSRYDSATYEIFEVGRDGVPKPMQVQPEQTYVGGGDGDGDNQDASIWRVMKDINADGNAVGRMT